MSLDWLGVGKMTPASQTHNWLKYKQGPSLFMFSEKVNSHVHLKCALSIIAKTPFCIHKHESIWKQKLIVEVA